MHKVQVRIGETIFFHETVKVQAHCRLSASIIADSTVSGTMDLDASSLSQLDLCFRVAQPLCVAIELRPDSANLKCGPNDAGAYLLEQLNNQEVNFLECACEYLTASFIVLGTAQLQSLKIGGSRKRKFIHGTERADPARAEAAMSFRSVEPTACAGKSER